MISVRPGDPPANLTGGSRACADAQLRWLPRVPSPEMATTSRELSSAATAVAMSDPLVSVVIPCLNEEANIERCVSLALEVLDESGIRGEVVVADNASEDRSAELAAAAGARVVHEPRRGYGSAYLAGFEAARGRYIVMADADLTYDFREIPRFVEQLEAGRRAGDGRPDGQHPPGRDALAAPLRRQPGAHRRPQPLLPHRGVGCALRNARPALGRPPAARPADHRDGVRLGDGHPGCEGEPRHPRVPDRVPPARRSTASCRASATAGGTCASCSSTARPTSSSFRAC